MSNTPIIRKIGQMLVSAPGYLSPIGATMISGCSLGETGHST